MILLTLNYIADYPLQGEWMSVAKKTDDYVLYVHSMIWAGVMSLGLYYLGILALWKFVFLFAGHFVCDRWKARKKNATHDDWMIDQTWHVTQMFTVLLF